MRTIVIKDRIVIPLGRIGDNEATTIKFNIASFFPGLSGAQYELVHKLPKAANPYPVLQKENGRVRDGFINWVVKSSDLGTVAGNGVAQLSAYVGDTRVRSVVFTTQIANGMGFGPVPDDPEDPWVENVLEAGRTARDAASSAATYASRAEAAANGIEATIDAALAEAKASGEFDGEDGYSPTVTVRPITGGHEVTITDVNGDHVFNVMDGVGGGGATDVFWATFGTTTAAAMISAHQAGMLVLCATSTNDAWSVYYLTGYDNSDDTPAVSLISTDGAALNIVNVMDSDGMPTWAREVYYYPYSTNTTPQMDGVGSAGTNNGRYARADHVHPVDISRAPAAAGVPVGGSKYYALVKKSSTDYDMEWAQLSKWVNVTYNPTTGVAVANIAPGDLIGQKLDFAIYSSYDNGAHYFNIPMVYAEYFVPGGSTETYYQFRFEGLAQDAQGNPIVVVYDFPMQARDATSMVGTGTVYKLALAT